MADLKLVSGEQLDRFTEKISKPIKNISTELENLKTDLSDCVGYRKFSGEWITAQHTLEDKTRNLAIEGNTKYVKDGVILDEWQEGCELKSVGDLQGNGKYKIGLISSNYNLFNSFTNIKALDADNVVLKNNYLEGTYKGNAWIIFKIATPRFKKNTTIIIRGKYTNEVEATGKIEIFQDLNKTGTMTACDIKKGEFVAKLKLKHDTDTLVISARNANGSSGKKVVFSKLIIEKDTDLNLDVEGNYDKKQILLQEPLNGIGNVRDIKDNKKIIRKTSLRVLNGSEDWILQRQNDNIIRFTIPRTSLFMDNIKQASLCLCDGFVDINSITPTPDEYCVGVNVGQNDGLVFRVPKSSLETPDVSGFKKFLAKKNLKIVLILEKSIIEEVEQDMCLNTYKDLTHIYTDTEIQGNISFSTLIDLGNTINRLESTNTANLKLIEEQESKLEEQTHIILENDFRLCILELGL